MRAHNLLIFRFMWFHASTVFCLILLLPGTGHAEDSEGWRLRLGSAPLYFHEPGFDGAVNSFFSTGGGFFDLTGDDLRGSGGGGGRDDTVSPRVPVSLRLSWRKNLSNAPVHGFVEFGGSLGQGSYFLPEGARPFIDPITVRIRNVSVDARLGAAWERRRFGMSGGIGLDASRVHTSITSALLDVQHRQTFTTPFLFGEVRYAPTRQIDVTLGALWSRNMKFEPTWSAEWRF